MPVAACICLAAACILAYANSLTVPFLFDDTGCIVENQSIRSLTNLQQVLSPPREGRTVQGRPLINLTFALNYAWSGLDVWSWHAVNIAIHALAGICLFGVTRQTLLSATIPESQRQRATPLAFAIGLLWMLHPLQTESVTYIVQRTEALAGLLLLATLYCSIRARQSSRRTSWSIAAVAACWLGMASKEVMVAAPLLVVLYDWTFSGEPLAEVVRQRWRFYASLAATWIVLAVLVADSASRGGSAGFGQGVTIWEYARTQFGFIVHYLRLSFWPHPLVLDYGNRLATQAGEIIPAGLCVLSLVAGTVAALACRRCRPFGFLGAWFFCILAPSSCIVPVILQTGAEHRMYLPLAAVVALVVVTASRIIYGSFKPAVFPPPRQSRWLAFVGPALVGSVALALGCATVHRNVDYQSTLSIWRDTVEKCPDNWRALCNLGEEYASAGELARAIECCDRSIQINPNSAAAFNNRGAIYIQLGNLDRAFPDIQHALEIDPRSPAAHANLGLARAAAGDLESALAAFTTAIRLSPSSAHIFGFRGGVLRQLGRHVEAIEDLSEAIRLDPRFDKALVARADCYRATRQLPRAIADLSRAIEINPLATYYLNRGIALGVAGRFEESVQDCSSAIRLKPDLLAAYGTRALSYTNLKRYDLARADLAHMERLGSPPDPRVLEILEKESPAR